MSTLSLNIGTGILQKSYDIIGSMENYVYLRLTADGRTQQYKTKIVTGRKQTPIVWNQTINISVPRNAWNNARLEVVIKDEDVTTDDICASGFINLEHCGFFSQPNVTVPYKIKLYEDNNKGVVGGQLNFTSTLR